MVLSSVKERKQCRRKNTCKYCPKLDLSGKIIGIHDKRSWGARMNANCQSNNCIYAIECTRCGQHYIGQTSRNVGRRMYEHLTSILQENKDLLVGDHFSKRNQHEGWKDFKFFILKFCSTPADEAHTKDREAIERKWQFRLRLRKKTTYQSIMYTIRSQEKNTWGVKALGSFYVTKHHWHIRLHAKLGKFASCSSIPLSYQFNLLLLVSNEVLNVILRYQFHAITRLLSR